MFLALRTTHSAGLGSPARRQARMPAATRHKVPNCGSRQLPAGKSISKPNPLWLNQPMNERLTGLPHEAPANPARDPLPARVYFEVDALPRLNR